MSDGPAQHTGSEAPPARLPGTAGPNGERAMCLALVDRAGLDRCNTGPTEQFGAKARPGSLPVGAYVAGRRWPTGDRTK